MILVFLLIFILSFIAPFIGENRRYGFPVLVGFSVLVWGYFLSLTGSVLQDGALYFNYSWANHLSVNFSFLVDGLSLFFALLIIFYGILILIYSSSYLKHEKHLGRFYGYLLFFMGSMLGLVLAANLISIFIFWELTSFSSYLLIGFYNRDEQSRQSARQALLITGAGGLALLAGFVFMGIAGGTYEIPELLSNQELILHHPYLQATVVLVLLGVFTKSAQFPFHFWLPNAMAAPTPVSAYLHSSTMVKAGIYLIFRLNPIFIHSDLWLALLISFGAITMLIGAVEAFRADDLKRILAFTTISVLGIFVLMAGMGTKESLMGAFIYLLAHSLYKGGLFLVAGIMDHQCGTRKLSELSKIKKNMPITAIAGGFACASMAGFIPFLGFTGKELLYKAIQPESLFHQSLLVLLVFSNVFFVAISLKIFFSLFSLRSKGMTSSEAKEGPPLMVIPSLVLGGLGLIIGAFSGITLQPISLAAVENIMMMPIDLDVGLWHGFNFILLLSMVTLLLGFGLYHVQERLLKALDKIKVPFEKIPEIFYKKGVNQLQSFSDFQTGIIQNGYLRNYITVCISVFVLLVTFCLFVTGIPDTVFINFQWYNVFDYNLILLILITVTLLFIFKSKTQLVVVAAIGIIGYAVALSYTMFSAPDVAITQFLAETLSLILLILIASRLPGLSDSGSKIKRRYLFVSISFGLLMTVITLIGMNVQKISTLKEYFLENSLPKGKGENVVNVILVDFRALDTLGEISVLVIAMIGIISLLSSKPIKP